MKVHSDLLPNARLPHRGTAEAIWIVDDCPDSVASLKRLCESLAMPIKGFCDPLSFLSELPAEATGVLVADLRMPELGGIELHHEVQRRNVWLETIVVSAFADASSCREAFRKGIFDFLEKQTRPHETLDVIRRGLSRNRKRVSEEARKAQRISKLEQLTLRELEVARLLSRGNSLKEIGRCLDISVQTASKHRGNVFQKLDVSNEVELYQTVADCLATLESVNQMSLRPRLYQGRTGTLV